MKRLGLFALVLALTVCLAAGCGKDKEEAPADGADAAQTPPSPARWTR